MTDSVYYDQAEHDHQKARIERLFQRWIKRIGLGWWRIDIDYADGLIGRHEDPDDCWSTVMVCEPAWQYMKASIAVSLQQCVGVSDEDLESYIVHELMHVFLSEMRETDDQEHKHEDRVASTLTNAFLWLRDAAVQGTLEEQITVKTGIAKEIHD